MSSCAKAVQARAPPIEVIFAVGENHDGPSLGMLLGAESIAGRVEGGPEVGSPGPDRPGPQPMQGIEHGTEVFGQRATEHPSAGERHHGRAVGRFARQGVDQALGRLDRRGQAIGNRVLDPHAPADVDHQHHVMARRNRRRRQPPPARLCQGDNQAGNARHERGRAVPWRTTSLRERLPASGPPAPPPDRPEDNARQDHEEPQQFRMSESQRRRLDLSRFFTCHFGHQAFETLILFIMAESPGRWQRHCCDLPTLDPAPRLALDQLDVLQPRSWSSGRRHLQASDACLGTR